MHKLEMCSCLIEGCEIAAISSDLAEETRFIKGFVRGYIANSVGEKKRRDDWKLAVGTKVQSLRNGRQFNPECRHAITLAFRFHHASHGKQRLDVENYLKPTLDALAAGLFCNEPLQSLTRWNQDDSGFIPLLVHRLDDVNTSQEEGVFICVCPIKQEGA